MTARALIRKLEKAIKEHGERVRVTIDLTPAHYGDGYMTHNEVTELEVHTMRWADDDGNFELKDGTERMRTVVVLS